MALLIRGGKTKWLGYLGYFSLVFFLSFFICHASILANLNYLLDQKPPVEYTAIIEEKDINTHRRGPTDYRFKVTTNGDTFYLNVNKAEYRQHKVGDEYSFQKYGGAFGVPFYVAE